MESFYDMQSQAIRKMANAEEEVIKKVLRQILKREPIIEDAKKCTCLFRRDNINQYDFIYDGVCLGNIKRNFGKITDNIPNFNIEFTPAEEFK